MISDSIDIIRKVISMTDDPNIIVKKVGPQINFINEILKSMNDNMRDE